MSDAQPIPADPTFAAPATPKIQEDLAVAGPPAIIAGEPPASERETPEAPHLSVNPKEHAPMLDVHPAQHAASSWKEFFIHIATIVLGLLIAVGLEQSVEYVHHRRALSQARRELQEEKRANIDGFRHSETSFQASNVYLNEYLATLRKSIKDPNVPLPALHVPIDFVYFQYTAWDTAGREGALTLMPSEEQSANDRMYVGLHTVDELEDRAYVSALHAESVFLGGLDPHDLTPEQKKDLYRDATQALSDVRYAIVSQRITVHFNPEFGDERSHNANAGELEPEGPGH